MKQIIAFAIFAMLIAGILPRVISHVGQDQVAEAKPAMRAEPAQKPQTQSSYRTVTVESSRGGHFEVEGSVDGRRLDFLVDTGATVVALRERDANRLGIFPRPTEYTGRTSTANGVIAVAPEKNSVVYYWASFKINSNDIEASEEGMLNALRNSMVSDSAN